MRLLAVGTENGLAVYTSTLENDLPTWSRKWHVKCPTPSLVTFAPSLMYIATMPQDSNFVRLYSTTSGRQTQAITHSRRVVNICWRHSQASSRDDLILYTITADSTLRIFLPVLDSPRTLQLHASLDLSSSLPLTTAVPYPSTSRVFWLDREQIDPTLKRILKSYSGTDDDAQIRVLKDIVDEKWELFLRVLDDGSVVLNSVANIDRRPPTLLQQFTLQYHPPNSIPSDPCTPTQLHVLPSSSDPTKLSLVTSPNPLRSYTLSPIEFFGPSVVPPPLLKSPKISKRPRTSTSTRSTPSSPVEPYRTVRLHSYDKDVTSVGTTGLELVAKGLKSFKNEDREITRFVRTSEGHAVGVIRSGRVGEVWRMPEVDEFMVSGEEGRESLVHAGDFEDTDFVVVLNRGYSFATYSSTTLLLTLYTHPHHHHHQTSSTKAASTLTVPKLESLFTYPTPSTAPSFPTAYTDESIFGITTDYCVVHIRIEKHTSKLVLDSCVRLPDLPTLPSSIASNGSLKVVNGNGHGGASHTSTPRPRSPNETAVLSGSVTPKNVNGGTTNGHSHSNTASNPIKKIIPVDPMAWGWSWDSYYYSYDTYNDPIRSSPLSPRSRSRIFLGNVRNKRNGRGAWEEHDVLLSVSENGELGFWVPASVGASKNGSAEVNGGDVKTTWRCTGRVRTGRAGFNRARCSSAKKTALVVPSAGGDELTIWDSMESEFASGLEYCGVFDQPILDLDWNSTPDMQSILAVGFAHHVELLCQQRMTYFDEGPGWALCFRVDISGFTPYSISDSIWLSHGSFLVGSGNQMTIYGEPKILGQRRVRGKDERDDDESLFEYVARQNGPLDDYHPQMMLQCLLWGKAELVKDVIVNLARAVGVQKAKAKEGEQSVWQPLPVERFLGDESESRASKIVVTRKSFNLFAANSSDGSEEEQGFSRSLVEDLLEALETNPLPHLTPNEHAHLLVLIQATLEIDEQRRALDANGLRYLISMRSFYILNQRATSPTSPASPPSQPSTNGTVPRSTGFRERLRYRDMIWAFHSESQELLVGACVNACKGKMTWADARALGIPVWLNSVESLKTQMETIARNEYMAGDNRDPVACSLFYFALGKHKLVHGLWRQAAWHNEQGLMLKFLANDFSQARWKTAAMKNAYALLGKRRFEYAAAFFLLGGSLKDAVNVCIRQLGDFQLALALARVVEPNSEGAIIQGILRNTVLPIAFRTGNRWLGSWAFWLLHRRDLAVRILLTPLPDIAAAYDILVEEIGEPHYDDPSLALLFSQLRSKTLQAVQGTSEIPGRSEFNFVLQMARVFCRMGCHVLALDLVRSWSFERPSMAYLRASAQESPDATELSHPPPSPTSTRRNAFPLDASLRRRRSSIMIDMDILSLPSPDSTSPTRDDMSASRKSIEKTSPVVPTVPTIKEEENDILSRKAGLGSLMKSAKQDVQVPEFDMSAFAF
ncbi:hypothetical protein NP233_g10818 [Leucocoprinus birnbaumii]|uniref:RAVE complex protein Rav1 C-terminal domain-containing protein n=1 Tax=Leucocoprinus birnbaumii TaxID=56174 RepID=A0AAD5VK20_9AGAR|nr:hypothetical protein NP233_g10818 [Leucocoprinus birnbaumii]